LGAATLAFAGVSVAAVVNGQEFNVNYTTSKPEVLTGIKAHLNNPGTKDATGKPKAARKIIVTFPRGTAFNNAVRPACVKAQLQSKGPSGCPAKSKMGSGSADAVTGLAAIDPVNVTVTPYNKKGGLLLWIQPKPGEPGNPFVIDATIRRNVLTFIVPKLPQPTPFGEAILTRFDLTVNAISKGSGSGKQLFITTASCSTGTWTTAAKFSYDVGSTTVKDKSPCRRS